MKLWEGKTITPGDRYDHTLTKGTFLKPRRFIKVSLVVFLLCSVYVYSRYGESMLSLPSISTGCSSTNFACHIDKAIKDMGRLQAKQSRTVTEANIRYRRRYKRNPPPGFNKWVEYALENNAKLIDEYDQLESDLIPFRKRGLSSSDWAGKIQEAIRLSINIGEQKDDKLGLLEIRNGSVFISGMQDGPMSISTVREIVEPIVERLPDVKVLYNFLATGRLAASTQDHRLFSTIDLSHKPTLPFLQTHCATEHGGSKLSLQGSYTTDICNRKVADFSDKHGFLSAPSYFQPFVGDLVPIISRAKMSTMTDILAANPCYAHKAYRQWGHEDKIAYVNKSDSLFWKGASTGIWINESSQWNLGHRQRFVNTIAQLNHTLRDTAFDVAFTKLVNCDGQACDDFQKQFPIAAREPPTSGYKHKLVADIDGEGMSCRFYRQLSSNSLPIKQTLWTEWHSDRIMPWLHYIPLSLEMAELPELISWLLHDRKGMQYAAFVARSGSDWAAMSLRKIDITIHYYRLLLELGALQA